MSKQIFLPTEIIDNVLNDLPIAKDLHGLIKEFYYYKCNDCNQCLYPTHDMNNRYDDTFICFECMRNDTYRLCIRCNSYYKPEETNHCVLCNRQCIVHCYNCFLIS